MTVTIEAIYQQGTLKLSQPIALAEGSEVEIIIVTPSENLETKTNPSQISAEITAMPLEGAYKNIETLPEEAQILLLAFIKSLKQRYTNPELVNPDKTKSLYDRFEEIGLIGCCSVEENLSTTYKEIMANTLASKYDHH